jgi:hypothetical protein
MSKGVVALILGVVGVVFLVIGLFIGAKKREAAAYVEADGTIISSHVRSWQEHGEHENTMYQPEVSYRYEVNGQSYTGDSYSFFGTVSSSSRGWADEIVRKYPVGSKCKVYHDAKDPSKSLLVKDPGGVISCLPTIFAAIGVALLVPAIAIAVLLAVGAGTSLARRPERTAGEAVSEAPVRPADYTPARSVEPPPPPEDLEAEDAEDVEDADRGDG